MGVYYLYQQMMFVIRQATANKGITIAPTRAPSSNVVGVGSVHGDDSFTEILS